LIDKAETVYVVGFRRSFPVASYLAYSLQQLNKRTLFIDGVAGLTKQQVQTIGPKDLLIAVSYHPYAEETVMAVEMAGAARRQDPVDQRQPGQPDRQAGRTGAARARIGGPHLPLAGRVHLPGPGPGDRFRLRGGQAKGQGQEGLLKIR
jgi:hypothetical protein